LSMAVMIEFGMQDMFAKPAGVIHLTGCSVLSMNSAEDPFCFVVTLNSRKDTRYYLKAKNLVEMNEWIAALNGAISQGDCGC
jgi:hypothetical protein